MKVTIGDMTFEADENRVATSSRYAEFLEMALEIEKVRASRPIPAPAMPAPLPTGPWPSPIITCAADNTVSVDMP